MIESTPTRTWVVIGFVVVGTFFLTVGTIGLLRLSERSRSFSPGSCTSVRGAGLSSLIGIVFLFLTVPTGAHMIASGGTDRGPVPRVGDVAGEVRRRVGELPTIVD